MVRNKEQKMERKRKESRQATSEFGKIFFSWSFPEYGTAWRERQWFVWAIVVAAVLLLYSLISGNYLFGIIIVLIGIIYAFQSFDSPLAVDCQITEDGIVLGRTFYDYRDLSQFWIIYEPPAVKNLYIEFRNPLRPRLGIPLDQVNPIAVRDVLKQYLDEDAEREHEPLSDGLSRIFRMH